ncbi:hypothetical protein CASFOL_003196 [Castilleja foliolosa]|uniref:Uncharacterized protein n=1 Tax=Castilleja foliolosa TaxID=1961234 RepID=A0ABD3EK68_9LAMI
MRRALGFLGRRLFTSNNAKSSLAKVKDSHSLPEVKKPKTMLGSVREVLWRRKTIIASIGVVAPVSIFIAYQSNSSVGPPFPGANFPAVGGAPLGLVLKLALQRNVNDTLRLSIDGLWIQKAKGIAES